MNLAELLVDENIDQVLALNTRSEIIFWNKTCETVTGIKKEDAVGKDVFSVLPQLVTDADDSAALLAAGNGQKCFVPYKKSSAGKHIEKHFVPLKDDMGHVMGVMIIKHDVAHLVKAENELRTLNESLENFKRIIDAAHDAIVTFDTEGNITYWNAAADKLFGYNPSEILGRSVGCLLPEEDRSKAAGILESLRSDAIVDLVIKQLTKDGRIIDVIVNIFPLIDEQNNFIGGCKIVKDVTDLLKYKNDIELLNKELKSKNRQLASVNSELKTFTNIAVNNYSETLRQLYLHFEYITAHEAGKLSDPGKANIRKAQAAIQKMKLLTSDITAFTRLNEFDTELTTIDLNTVVGTIIEDIKEKSDASTIDFSVDTLPTIKGYPFLISMVFHHLLDNAIKFRKDKGQLQISISSHVHPKGAKIKNDLASADTDYNVITVRDNGIGYPKDQDEHIFMIFTRLHAKQKGSGIGLAICKKAMELHHGFIISESEEGVGSAFCCFFPKN
jgi:PAS domain S-box-containing protein